MGKKKEVQITIVGLGMVGASIGMALRREKGKFRLVGHDKSPEAMKRALKLGAVEKTSWNLINACDGASLIILALPFGEIKATMEALGREMRSGILVMDTAPLKKPVQDWAGEYLAPRGIAYLGGDPVIPMAEKAGAGGPRADLFDRRTFCFCPTVDTPETAIRIASDLADRLKANPLFLDAEEHDALRAGVDHFPMLLGAAFLSSTVGNEAWRELRRLAGKRFEEITDLGEEPEGLTELFMANRDNLVRWIEVYSRVLDKWKEMLASGDAESITATLEVSVERREEWLNASATGRWEEPLATIEREGIFSRMFGLGAFTRKRKSR